MLSDPTWQAGFVLRSMLNTLLPRRCPGCQGQLGQEVGLCAACRAFLRPQLLSHSPLSPTVTPHLVLLGPYRGVLGRSVKALKYGRSRELGSVLGTPLALGVPAGWGVQAVTAVPLHPERLRERGFNQAELIGNQIARQLNVPYLKALSRSRATGHQAARHAKDRLGALGGAFTAQAGLPETVLLVDDVLTTGTTLLACAGALQSAGVRQVYFATVAR